MVTNILQNVFFVLTRMNKLINIRMIFFFDYYASKQYWDYLAKMKILHCNHSNNLMLVIILCTFIIEHITKFIVHKKMWAKNTSFIWCQCRLYLCMFVQLWDSLYEVYLDISLDLLVAMWVGDFSSSSACRIVGGTMWQSGAATSICLFSDCCPLNWLWYGLYGLSLFHGPPFWFPAQACALASYTWSDLVVTSFCYSSINYSNLLSKNH